MTYLAPNSVQARDIASIVHPQTNLVRHMEEGPLVIGNGEGCFVTDDSGKRYLDGISSWWVNLFGHANPRINAALPITQSSRVKFAISMIVGTPRPSSPIITP